MGSQNNTHAAEMYKAEEVFDVKFVSSHQATEVVQPCEQSLNSPAMPIPAQLAAILSSVPDAVTLMWCDHVDTLDLKLGIQPIAVVSAVADQSFGSFGEEALLDRGFDELCFMRRSAGHVHRERKTMAVADRHDFAAFAAASRADSRAPFFAELKLASMNDSLRSGFPRSRKSSASF